MNKAVAKMQHEHEGDGTMPRIVVYIGDRLRTLRQEKFFSQRELAEAARLSPATILKLETNRAEPHPRTIRKLAKALEVEPSELVSRN